MSKHDVFGQIKMSPSMFYYVIVKLIYWIFNQVLRSTFTRQRMNFRPVAGKFIRLGVPFTRNWVP